MHVRRRLEHFRGMFETLVWKLECQPSRDPSAPFAYKLDHLRHHNNPFTSQDSGFRQPLRLTDQRTIIHVSACRQSLATFSAAYEEARIL
mgnify:CR=1 FL=1